MLKLNEIEVVILAEGDYPTHELPLSILNHCDKVICCDGAANTFINIGKMPMATIGDGDSISEELKGKLHFIQVDDQETNDLTKAINYAKDLGYKNIAILGATSGTTDMYLGKTIHLFGHRSPTAVVLASTIW